MMTRSDSEGQQIPSEIDPKSYLYDLPDELIASRPASPRHGSKLLVYKKKQDQVIESSFEQLDSFIDQETRMVFNQTKVYPARLNAFKKTGGKAEIFILSLEGRDNCYPCLIKTSSRKKIGQEFFFDDHCRGVISTIQEDGTFLVTFNAPIENIIKSYGRVPIPPYIRNGESDEQDLIDYQTVFAKESGSVAAPTAGLHFTEDVFKKLKGKNIKQSYLSLHIGLGTFAPLKDEQLLSRKLHEERYFISQDDFQAISCAKNLLAVGTTSLRGLESLFREVEMTDKPFEEKYRTTDIFLYPGQEIKSAKNLITNFHLPGSSLMMLVATLIGREKLLDLYQFAVKKNYRFYSYGDAMLILDQ